MTMPEIPYLPEHTDEFRAMQDAFNAEAEPLRQRYDELRNLRNTLVLDGSIATVNELLKQMDEAIVALQTDYRAKMKAIEDKFYANQSAGGPPVS